MGDPPKTVKVLRFHPEKCDGCRVCEKACSQIHFKTDEGGDKSAIRILMNKTTRVRLKRDLDTVKKELGL